MPTWKNVVFSLLSFQIVFLSKHSDSTINRGFSKNVIRCGEPIRLNQQTYAILAMAANGIRLIDRGVPAGKLTYLSKMAICSEFSL